MVARLGMDLSCQIHAVGIIIAYILHLWLYNQGYLSTISFLLMLIPAPIGLRQVKFNSFSTMFAAQMYIFPCPLFSTVFYICILTSIVPKSKGLEQTNDTVLQAIATGLKQTGNMSMSRRTFNAPLTAIITHNFHFTKGLLLTKIGQMKLISLLLLFINVDYLFIFAVDF